MRILFLTQWFQPEPSFKGLPLAKVLRDLGHEVEVLTGFPNYPGGKIYPGYRLRLFQREWMDGVRITRVPLFPSHDRSAWRRMLNYVSFGASALLLGAWLVRKPDVVYVLNLVTLSPAAALLRWRGGGRVVLDITDLWPEAVASSGMMKSRGLYRVLNWCCRKAYEGADRLIAVTPGFKRSLIDRGLPQEKIDVIYNWCDDATLQVPASDPGAAERLGFAGRFNIVYAGAMGLPQALDVVIEAARELQTVAPDVLFTLIGKGVDVDRLKSLAADSPNVRFLPPVPLSEVGALLAQADGLLLHLKNDPLFEIWIPSKLQAYLHAGRPILNGVRGDAADVVRDADAGFCFEPGDAEQLVRAVLALRALPAERRATLGVNGRRFYGAMMSMEHGVQRLTSVFDASRRDGSTRSDAARSDIAVKRCDQGVGVNAAAGSGDFQ